MEGSRVRLRLLDDVEINETVVKSGSYLYAIMSGFSSQRVKGTISSVLVNDEIIKVSLSLYDTDGLEGLYVPSSSFRETAKDVASGAFNSNMSMNTGGNGEQSDPMGYAGYSGCLPEDQQRHQQEHQEEQGQSEIRHVCLYHQQPGEKIIQSK